MAFWNRKSEVDTAFKAPTQDTLTQDFEVEDQGISKEQLLCALNAAQTALMMIDRDFNITYINKKSIELLKVHEALFRSVWPNFQATEEFLLGYCIDAFHVNPSHQR
ncbi:PAS domain-containing protein, partial [Vibrio sinaloensis]